MYVIYPCILQELLARKTPYYSLRNDGKTGRRARRPRGAAAQATATAPVAEQSPAPAAPTAGQPATAVTGGQAPKVISPLVRREAAERGIDVATAGIEVLDGLWEEVKQGEEAGRDEPSPR